MFSKKSKYVLVILICFGICVSYLPYIQRRGSSAEESSSDINTSTIIDSSEILDLLNEKLIEYGYRGYFPQLYEPSLQAIYYAVYILDAIGKLDAVNTDQITNIIISYYNESEGIFMDEYTYRFLDTDPLLIIYPFSSLLEINCYAVLALEILDDLDLIDQDAMLNFIWSCYNPVSSGFLGLPFNILLPYILKNSTMDNTYYAIKVIDTLSDWATFPQFANALGVYISGLQSTYSFVGEFGGFYNDDNPNYDSLYLLEPNLLASYYCIKSLEILNKLNEMEASNFHLYLSELYNNTGEEYFYVSYFYPEILNLVATAIGVELSEITGFSGINRENSLNFVLNHRNFLGIWDQSTSIHYHELIDTFQIIRSLVELGEISRFNQTDIDQIVLAMERYHNLNGYSLLSGDYTSINLINTIISAFDLFEMTGALPITELYTGIKESYYYDNYFNIHSFYACMQMDTNFRFFRSFPIEYFSIGTHEHILELDWIQSHKATYLALDSLNKTFKLDDFDNERDIVKFIDSILDSQILDPGDENYGAFLSSKISFDTPYFEYSYYAIKSLELICEYLQLGSLRDIGFNVPALEQYILDHLIDNSYEIYLDPQYTSDTEVILQNTYFAVYILSTLNSYNLNNLKIQNYIINHLNYDNIKNIYYSYKIADLLELDLYLEEILIHDLIQNIYTSTINEFYLTVDRNEINQEAFYWVCDLVKNFKISSGGGREKDYEIDIIGSIPIIIFFTAGPLSIISLASKKWNKTKIKKKLK